MSKFCGVVIYDYKAQAKIVDKIMKVTVTFLYGEEK